MPFSIALVNENKQNRQPLEMIETEKEPQTYNHFRVHCLQGEGDDTPL